jgi:acetyl esterase
MIPSWLPLGTAVSIAPGRVSRIHEFEDSTRAMTNADTPRTNAPVALPSIDPEIAGFQRYLTDEFAKHGDISGLSPAAARRVMEELRAPLARGGPVMSATTEEELTIDGRAVRIRVYVPAPRSSAAALIYLHGGGWVLFSIDTHDRIMREYAARAGVVVIGVDYSRAPEARFPVALQQVIAVTRWARDHAATLGIDASRIALGGDSVGANLAMAAAVGLRDSGDRPAVAALLLNYGVYDNDFDNPSYRRFGQPGAVLTREEMKGFWDHYAASPDVFADPLACLAKADVRGLPPAHLAIAELDPLRDENEAMAARLRAAHVPVQSVIYPGTTHSFLEAVSMAEVSRRALAEGSLWLRATLGSAG